MRSSGVTGISTSGDAAVPVLARGQNLDNFVRVTNASLVAGFVSLDGGATWKYLPPGQAGAPYTIVFDLRRQPRYADVQLKRIASGTDVTGVYADTW